MPARLLLLLLALAAAAHAAASAPLRGTWVRRAKPAKLAPPRPAAACLCAPDPILPNPACILCLCGSRKAGNATWRSVSAQASKTRSCDLDNAKPTKIKYRAGAALKCACAPDPFLTNPAWVLCKCPRAIPVKVPTTDVYTRWPAPTRNSPPLRQWARCKGPYALCSSANCTLTFRGGTSNVAPLAECGCILPTRTNGLTPRSYVNPSYILDKSLYRAGRKRCGSRGAQAPGCKGFNTIPVCKAIKKNTIYGGAYDFISTFTNSPQVGGFNKLCVRPEGGLYAQCMTAACYKRRAFDGSPVTCYCPVYKSTRYLIGSPLNDTDSCTPNLPYVLSGVDASGGSGS